MLTLDIGRTLDNAKRCKPFLVVALLRTWFNGWTTSYRAHSNKTTCIFGCSAEAEDRLLHYAVCQPLWMAIYSSVEVSDEIALLRSLALRLDGDVASDLRCLAIAVDVYNNCKGKVRNNLKAQMADSTRRMTML